MLCTPPARTPPAATPARSAEPDEVGKSSVASDVICSAPGLLLLVYGLRRREVLGLSWRDLDLENGVIRIRQQLVRIGGRLRLGPVKTSAGRRELPLIGIAVDALIEQAQMRI